ncbi:hypothetical protein BGZ96_005037 [Linnemannia gamsii]|uniref:Uncharacterized protein n=1 Tax=Linnemannia gamsii TaxID=64522 RepID=A0ABQ7K788_9FUNG|nr:hypothetical protein BGZ96_005037 [Linnemannia gamsii]
MTKYVYPGKMFKLETSRYLNSVPSIITSLELDGISYGDALLNYMYSAPRLRELKVPYFKIAVNFLVHYVGLGTENIEQQQQVQVTNSSAASASISNSTTPPLSNGQVRRVWACRKLRFLYIGFRSIGEIKTTDPSVSRFIFGYLARVCPHLQDLEIRGFTLLNDQPDYYTPLCLKLEGGFCLLTRLQNLERLQIGAYELQPDLHPWDLDWMVANGRTSIRRAHRRMVADRWRRRYVRSNNDDERALRCLGEKLTWDVGFSSPADGGESSDLLGQQDLEWDQIGLLKDVEAVMQEMDAKNFTCWRELRRLSIYDVNPLGLPVESEIRRLFSGFGPYNIVQVIMDAFR